MAIVNPLLDGIHVNSDCSGLDDLPDISFDIDSTTYTLGPHDYVVELNEYG